MITAACLILIGCGESPRNTSNFGTGDTGWTDRYDEESENDVAPSSDDVGYNSSQNNYIICQMCGGSGMMLYFDGTPMTCIGCNGRGGVTQEELQQIAEEMFNKGGNTSAGYSQGSGREAYLIEYELNKAYELLESMEEAYANSEGAVVRSQYPRMIADQKERIRQLEAELRNAQ